MDPLTFGMGIVLNRRLAPGRPRRFAFVESEPDQSVEDEAGLTAFLQDASLSRNVTRDGIEFLKRLRFKGSPPRSTITGNCRTSEARSIFGSRRVSRQYRSTGGRQSWSARPMS